MKEYSIHEPRFSLLLLFVFIISCNGQGKKYLAKESISEPKTALAEQIKIYGSVPDPFLDGQISQFVRRIFQDKNGNLWLGTNGDGVCRYDPAKGGLTYFTTTEGFGGHAVRGIVEDVSGNIWFATDGGVCRYDGSRANYPCNNNSCKHDLQTEKGFNDHSQELAKSFTNYTMKDGLGSDQVWSILIDRDGNVWCGTEGGAARFDGKNLPTGQAGFTSFPIPEADLKDFPNAYPAPKLINCIVQDKTGNIWFGSNGNGVYRYDGTLLTNISEKDGLCNNVVQCILEDRNGNLWFGSRFGGLSRYNPSTGGFTNFTTKDGLSTDFIWTMLEDKTVPAGEVGIWISVTAGGLCHYDTAKGDAPNFAVKEGLSTKHVQSIFADKNGKLWLGCSGGLFRFDPANGKFINVTRLGPWQ